MNEEGRLVGVSSYGNETIVHPLGLLVVIVLGILLLTVSRRRAAWPFLIMACFVSSAQRIVIAGLDWDFMRIIVLFGLARILFRKEYVGLKWNPLDRALVYCTLSAMFFYIVEYGTFSAVVNRLGLAFSAFGLYFCFRCFIRTWADLDSIILAFILISIPEALFFLIENQTGRNAFAFFGGVPEITFVRDGRLRCQGPFAHPITAGCFWASVVPLVAARWWNAAASRFLTALGVICATIVTLLSASSTPYLGLLAAAIAAGAFVVRRHMRPIRWSILFALIGLHLVMNAPVWHLIARVSAVSGSTAYHRYALINETINHFDEWWFSGCSYAAVRSWGIHAGDVTNHYIFMGVTGGLATMVLFIVMIAVAFGTVGKSWRVQRRHRYREVLSWALGVSLFAHCIMFIGVSYFGQINLVWYLLLAMIGSLQGMARTQDAARRNQAAGNWLVRRSLPRPRIRKPALQA